MFKPHLVFNLILASLALGVGLLWINNFKLLQDEQVSLKSQVSAYQQAEILNTTDVPVLDSDAQLAQDLKNRFLSTISAQSVYVMDSDSGSVLLEKNSSLVKAPASITKLLTALVVRENYPLNQEITVKDEYLTEGTTIGFVPEEKLTVESLLKALLIHSANDAAYILANNYQEGYAGFITKMNQLASRLNLNNTYFTNPAGLDDQYHQSTARDIAILTKAVMADDVLKPMVGTKQAVISDQQQQHQHFLYTTNALLTTRNDVVGVKTGTTQAAGEALVTQVEKEGRKIVIVVLTSQDRYQDTNLIIDWVFANYNWQKAEQIGQ